MRGQATFFSSSDRPARNVFTPAQLPSVTLRFHAASSWSNGSAGALGRGVPSPPGDGASPGTAPPATSTTCPLGRTIVVVSAAAGSADGGAVGSVADVPAAGVATPGCEPG